MNHLTTSSVYQWIDSTHSSKLTGGGCRARVMKLREKYSTPLVAAESFKCTIVQHSSPIYSPVNVEVTCSGIGKAAVLILFPQFRKFIGCS